MLTYQPSLISGILAQGAKHLLMILTNGNQSPTGADLPHFSDPNRGEEVIKDIMAYIGFVALK